MEGKIKMNFVDLTSITNSFCSPKKSWHELLKAIHNIYKNFKKSEIAPEELYDLIQSEELNTGVPDIASIDVLTDTINRYINEYKIPGSTTLFLEYRRHAAIYLFSIGSQEKSLENLKDIITNINETIETSKLNLDINLVCVKDCIKLNMAAIHFWLEDYEESRHLLEEIITFYESTDDELYLIKMVNFISVAFTYLAWIYAKKNELEDAEKAFLHALKVIKTVKSYTKERLKEEGFINIKAKKIFIFDQLINFYSHVEQFDMCYQPLIEILKIMDKNTFSYDVDIGPQNHIYYYITATLYTLKGNNRIDFTKTLHYLINIMLIVYRNSESFENLPPAYYEKIVLIVDAIHRNKGRQIFHKEIRRNANDQTRESDDVFSELTPNEINQREKIAEIIEYVADYLDEIIAKFDFEKIFTLNPQSSNSTISDNIVNLEKYSNYFKNGEFTEFNFMNDIQARYSESKMQAELENKEIDEISLIRIDCDRVLLKFVNIVKDLVDCKHIPEKIIMEGLNGYLVIENDDLVLYSVYRFMARDGSHALYQETKIGEENDHRKDENAAKKMETLKVISVKNVENRFAPLYYKRISYKLSKDAKTFNFSVYFALINLLKSKKLYYPCVTLVSLFIVEVSSINFDLYEQAKGSQRMECFLFLFEFLVFIQVDMLINLKNFDRALYELMRIISPMNEFNFLIYKTLMGLCLSHTFYYDLATYNFCEGAAIIKPLLELYKTEDRVEQKDSKEKVIAEPKVKKKSTETYVSEMRMFYTSIQCFILGTIKLMNTVNKQKVRICFRCKTEDSSITAICLNCKKAIYCNRKCMKKNRRIHDMICRIHIDKFHMIKSLMDQMKENFEFYVEQNEKLNERRRKDNNLNIG